MLLLRIFPILKGLARKTLLLITATLASGIAYAEGELPDRQTELPAVEKPQDNKYLVPRDLVDIPAGEFGDKVKLGYSLFVDSQQMRGEYVGNEQNCVNCHMQAGMKPNAAPLREHTWPTLLTVRKTTR